MNSGSLPPWARIGTNCSAVDVFAANQRGQLFDGGEAEDGGNGQRRLKALLISVNSFMIMSE